MHVHVHFCVFKKKCHTLQWILIGQFKFSGVTFEGNENLNMSIHMKFSLLHSV